VDIKAHLTGVLTPTELDLMARSYDVTGDILITSIAPELEHKEQIIGQVLLGCHPNIKVVAKRRGCHHGEFRTRALAVIAGEKRLTTLHKENKIRLMVDLEHVYFSPRMAGERLRIAALVKPGEHVAVFGSGAGPLPLTIARHRAPIRVTGIEKNPVAHEYALLNRNLNKAEQNVRFLLGDATEIARHHMRCFHRILTMLPTDHSRLLESALFSLKPDGVLHHYAMVKQRDTEQVAREIRAVSKKMGLVISDLAPVRCGHCTPTSDRYCFTVQFTAY